MDNIIEFKDISIEYKMKHVNIRAVNKVSFGIERGKITAIVGESGSGKTTLVSSILRTISSPGEIVEGDVIFNGNNGETFNIVELNKTE